MIGLGRAYLGAILLSIDGVLGWPVTRAMKKLFYKLIQNYI